MDGLKAPRHQLMVLQRQSGRPRLKDRDRLVWMCLRRRIVDPTALSTREWR
jgi:hypothetical protein